MSKTIIKTEDFVTLRPSLISAMVKACRDNEINSLQTIFTELAEGWRRAVMRQEINDFFWDNGNAIVRMYKVFKDDSIDEIQVNVPKYGNDGDEKISLKTLFNDVQLTYADLRG